jgi:hypothetical protein
MTGERHTRTYMTREMGYTRTDMTGERYTKTYITGEMSDIQGQT